MRLRLATYNVHDCVGRDSQHDPERVATILAELDAQVIALQEITLDGAGRTLRLLEERANLRAIDGTLFERGGGRYGNLLLTGLPVIETRRHDLSLAGREPRGAVEILVDAGRAGLRVLATHLGLRSKERKTQLERLSAVVARDGRTDDGRAAAILGDFNVWFRSTALTPLLAAGFLHLPVPSYPSWPRPLVALDRIFARAPAVIARCWRHQSSQARVASDHLPIVAELSLP